MPKSTDEKCYHYWVMVGYDFNSDLTFYKMPGNINGKLLLYVYII